MNAIRIFKKENHTRTMWYFVSDKYQGAAESFSQLMAAAKKAGA